MAEVSEIYLYPVKSCRPIRLSAANVLSKGLEWDREWMIVKPDGKFITQRQFPILATIEIALPVEALDQKWRPFAPESALSIKAPGMEPLYVPLIPSYAREKIEVTVWEWTGLAYDEGETASEWLSKYIGQPGLRLVRFDTVDATRLTDPKYAPGYKTAFADGYPIHLISEASLEALNSRLTEPLPMNRFRPNIVVKGCEPFAEDFWKKFKIGSSGFQGVSLCPRCKVPTINQLTAEVGKEPLPALKKFRVGHLLAAVSSMRGQMYFGQNVVPEIRDNESTIISIGEQLQVLNKVESVAELMVGV